jgi:hypothetical protein
MPGLVYGTARRHAGTRTSRPSRGDPLAARLALASAIGNRGLQRLARGASPLGRSGCAAPGVRMLLRDVAAQAKAGPAPTKTEKSGSFIKFLGKHGAHGDWIKLGNYDIETLGEENTATFDLLVESTKAFGLGQAFDTGERMTVQIEERDENGHPVGPASVELMDAVITGIHRHDERLDDDKRHVRKTIQVDLAFSGTHQRLRHH